MTVLRDVLGALEQAQASMIDGRAVTAVEAAAARDALAVRLAALVDAARKPEDAAAMQRAVPPWARPLVDAGLLAQLAERASRVVPPPPPAATARTRLGRFPWEKGAYVGKHPEWGVSLPFWIENGRPGVSVAAVEAAERALGVALPTPYVEAMKQQNGGVSNYVDYFQGDVRVPVPAFLPLDYVIEANRFAEEWGTPANIIVIASGAHDWLGLDYRRGGEPSIVYQEDEDAPLERVAESFEQWLVGLE